MALFISVACFAFSLGVTSRMLDWSGLSCYVWQPLLTSGVVIANQVVKQLVGQKREKSTDAHKKRGQTYVFPHLRGNGDVEIPFVSVLWNCYKAA